MENSNIDDIGARITIFLFFIFFFFFRRNKIKRNNPRANLSNARSESKPFVGLYSRVTPTPYNGCPAEDDLAYGSLKSGARAGVRVRDNRMERVC